MKNNMRWWARVSSARLEHYCRSIRTYYVPYLSDDKEEEGEVDEKLLGR